MPEREDLCTAAGLLLRRMRELANKIADSESSLAEVREETASITEQWNALMKQMKEMTPGEPELT